MTPEIMNLVSSFLGSAGNQGRRGVSPWAVLAEEIGPSLSMVRTMRGEAQGSEMAVALASAGAERLGSGSMASRLGNIAIVPVYGPLMSRYSWAYCSYEEIVRDLRLAASSPGIEAIMMDIDSPGGRVSAVDTVPAEVARIREAIPVHAHIRGLGASAAFWIASSAERVTAERTSLVGSVGALIHYVDMEGILTRLGAKAVSVIAEQSPNKRLDPASDEGRAELQAIVDDGAEMFIEALAENRGVSREEVLDRYGQGLVFTAREALTRGMIDAIEPIETVLAGLVARPGTSTGAGSTAAPIIETETVMDPKNTGAETAALTVESVQKDHPTIFAAILALGATAEGQRIAGIEEHAAGLTGVEDLVKDMKADGKTTPAEAAGKLLAASKANLGERMKGLQALDNAAAGVESQSSTTGGGDAAVPQTEEGWKAQYAADPKIRAEFPTEAAYVATKKREAA